MDANEANVSDIFSFREGLRNCHNVKHYFQTPVSCAVCRRRPRLISYSLDVLAFILRRFSGDGVRVGSLFSGAVDVRDRVQREERVIKS